MRKSTRQVSVDAVAKWVFTSLAVLFVSLTLIGKLDGLMAAVLILLVATNLNVLSVRVMLRKLTNETDRQSQAPMDTDSTL